MNRNLTMLLRPKGEGAVNTNYTWDDLLVRITKLEAERILVEEAFKAAFIIDNLCGVIFYRSKEESPIVPLRIASKIRKAMVAMGMIEKEGK